MRRRRKDVMDITGLRFGYLVCLRIDPDASHKPARWIVRCDCGVEKSVNGANLRRGSYKSCGCQRSVLLSANSGTRTHGMVDTPTYRSWRSMINRCTNQKAPDYVRYGGRGIGVCERWRHDFAAFLADMGVRPSPKHSLDRVDVNGNYEPGNCRWATAKQQQRNRRDNRILELNGQARTVTEWAEQLNVPVFLLFQRLKRGWPVERVLGKAWTPKTRKQHEP